MSADIVSIALKMVGPAETAFRSRWRMSTLKRVNADLHQMLVEQIDLYNTSMVTGSDAEVQAQSEAMVRGWRAACAALESPLLPDDAYLVGFDGNTGTRVVIANQQASLARVQSVNGERVVLITPDEVAIMMGGMSLLTEAKRFFPDAEVVSFGGAA